MFTINFRVDKRSLGSFKEMEKEVEEGLVKGMRDAMFFAEAKAKGRFGTPGNLKVKTGRLRQSITSSVEKEGTEVVGSIGSNIIYAGIHELGGVIRPRSGKYLHFKNQAGDWVTAMQSNIPARPYLQPSIEENWDKIEGIILDRIINSVKE